MVLSLCISSLGSARLGGLVGKMVMMNKFDLNSCLAIYWKIIGEPHAVLRASIELVSPPLPVFPSGSIFHDNDMESQLENAQGQSSHPQDFSYLCCII